MLFVNGNFSFLTQFFSLLSLLFPVFPFFPESHCSIPESVFQTDIGIQPAAQNLTGNTPYPSFFSPAGLVYAHRYHNTSRIPFIRSAFMLLIRLRLEASYTAVCPALCTANKSAVRESYYYLSSSECFIVQSHLNLMTSEQKLFCDLV